MGTLRKRKTKSGFQFALDFRYKGKRHVLSLKTSDKKLAERVKADIEAKIVLGKFSIEEIGQNDIMLSDYLQIYFNSVQGTKMESTLDGEKIYSRTFTRIVGNRPLRAITNVLVERWRHERLTRVSPVTFNDERRALSHIFNKAIEYGYIQKNPFKLIKRLKEQQKRLYLTSDELKRFFDELQYLCMTARNREHRAGYYKFKLYCEVLLNTGMRRSELLGLKVDQVDFDNDLIRLERTKGRKRREIPMTGRVREILGELSPSLFEELSKDQVSHKFTDCAKRIGLEGMKLHSLRHTFGTYLIAMGYDLTVAKELLGHEDIKTTLIYAKADTRLLREAMHSFDVLGRNGYKMVTRTETGGEKLLEGKASIISDDSS